MKTLKIVITVILIYTGTYFSGCNNEFSSPVNSKISDAEKLNSDELHLDSAIHRIIKLKPHQTYTFNYLNTGFRIFRSLNAPNCEELENIIQIRGYADDGEVFIECGDNNFSALEVNIINLTSGYVYLDLTLTGSRKIINTIHQPY